MGYRESHQYSPIDDRVSEYCQVDVIANFEERYLRDVAVEHNGILIPEIDALRNHQREGTKLGMYSCVAKLFTKASLLLCANGKWAEFYCKHYTDLRCKNPTMQNASLRSCVLRK